MKAAEKIKEIKSKNDFISFVNDLSKDYYDNPESWENNDIGTFLEALAAWVEYIEVFYQNQGIPFPEAPDWKMVANLLVAGKYYE